MGVPIPWTKVGKSHTILHGTQHQNWDNYFAPKKRYDTTTKATVRIHILPWYTWIYLKPAWTGLLLATVTSGAPLSSQVLAAMPAAMAPETEGWLTPRIHMLTWGHKWKNHGDLKKDNHVSLSSVTYDKLELSRTRTAQRWTVEEHGFIWEAVPSAWKRLCTNLVQGITWILRIISNVS